MLFSQNTLERYAEVLLAFLKLSRKTPFAKGEPVLVNFDVQALALAEVLHRRLLSANLKPLLRMNPTETMERDHFEIARFNQLRFQPPGERELAYALGGIVNLLAPASLTHLRGVDQEDLKTFRQARYEVEGIFNKRQKLGEMGTTTALYPTEALAAAAGQSLTQYARRIETGCLLQHSQPEKKWRLLRRDVLEVCRWLDSLQARRLHVESETIDLVLDVGERRRWMAVTGHNLPSFECYLSPDWRGTNGVYHADLPTMLDGHEAGGIRLEFSGGRAVNVVAQKNAAFVARMLSLDPGASKVGEFSLTDARFSPVDAYMAHPLYDENHGGAFGNCHLGLGAAYTETYDGDPAGLVPERRHELGFNASNLHWDLVNTKDKRVRAVLPDGTRRTIYESGRFLC